jgi:hypothetical protein
MKMELSGKSNQYTLYCAADKGPSFSVLRKGDLTDISVLCIADNADTSPSSSYLPFYKPRAIVIHTFL